MARDDGFHTGFALPPTQAAAAHRQQERDFTNSQGSSRPAPAARKRVIQQRAQPRIKSNSSGRYSPPRQVPSGNQSGPIPQIGGPPDINQFLTGDTGYAQAMQQLQLLLQNFNADFTRRKGSLESDYGLSQKAMGDQKVKDLDLLEDDYSARGLVRSGLYGQAVGDYEREFNERMAQLARAQQEAMGMLTNEQSQFQSQQKLREQQAREEAIRRRAEQYGV